MADKIQRELRVAFSRRTQPIWFRILKWVLIVAAFVLFRHHAHFWYWVLGVLALSVGLHLFYRWKTETWTKPWGGWDDVSSAR